MHATVSAVSHPVQSAEVLSSGFVAVLFDLDGVLVDSARVVEQAWRHWADEQHIQAADVLAAVHGRTAREVVAMFAPHLDLDRQVLRISSDEASHGGELAVLPGASECLSLARRGRWAVVTSGGRDLATGRLAAVGLPMPPVLVTADDVARGKPDPEPYRRAAQALAVPAAGCVVVEDAPAGVLAAKRAGMTVLAVTTTHAAAELGKADLVVPTMHDVTRHLWPGSGRDDADSLLA
jgi:mannitol-1-/sugar-/sorbitol-6-phosphatase